MILIGYEASFYTVNFVTNIDMTKLIVARDYLAASLVVFLMGGTWLLLYSKNNSTVPTYLFEFHLTPFFIIFIFCAYIFSLTFYAVGYIPLFYNVPGAKYFQEFTEIYISYRPYYTLAINLSVAAIMSLIIIYLYETLPQRKIQILMGILLFSLLLLLTGKRGPLLLPFAYIVLGAFLVGKISALKGFIFFFLLIILASILHFIFNQQDDLGIGLLNSLSNSFFIGVRELARFFSNFDNEFLLGKSYVAALISFIPTEFSSLKSDFLYPRYLILLEGGDPNLSGGPRGTYIGEAYSNFGIIGVVIISWLFGLLFYYIFKMSLAVRVFSNNLMVKGVMSAFILQQFILAFFENGSSFLFHFASKYIFVFLILKMSCKKTHRVLID